jgi:hypothetical protein
MKDYMNVFLLYKLKEMNYSYGSKIHGSFHYRQLHIRTSEQKIDEKLQNSVK